jgi:hypothetical protein
MPNFNGIPLSSMAKKTYITSQSETDSIFHLDNLSPNDTFDSVLFTDSLVEALKWAVVHDQNVYKNYKMYWRNPWVQ